jgi:hypothetical protein
MPGARPRDILALEILQLGTPYGPRGAILDERMQQ